MKKQNIFLGEIAIPTKTEVDNIKATLDTISSIVGDNNTRTLWAAKYTVQSDNTVKLLPSSKLVGEETNLGGEIKMLGDCSKIKFGDILLIQYLSDDGSAVRSVASYNIICGSKHTLDTEDYYPDIALMACYDNALIKVRKDGVVINIEPRTWTGLIDTSTNSFTPARITNAANKTTESYTLKYENVHQGDIFTLYNTDGNYITQFKEYVVLTSTSASTAYVGVDLGALVCSKEDGKLYHFYTNGSISSVDAETLNGYKASENITIDKKSIPVRDNQGSISIAHINKAINNFNFVSAGWYRIYISNNGTHISQSIKLNINSGFAYTSNSSYTFEINIGWDNVCINQFASIAEYNVVDKIRILDKNQDKVCIDIHYSVSQSNDVYFNIEGVGNIQVLQNPEVPSDYRTTEFTTANGFKSQINNEVIHYNKTRLIEFKVGSTGNVITTEQFISKLNDLGALIGNTHTTFICSWNYSNNDRIDTPAGRIHLAGAIIRIYCQYYNFSTNNSSIQIEIITANSSTDSQAYANNIFVYRRQDNIGVWKRLVNSDELPLKGYTANFSNWSAIPCTTKLYSGRFSSDITIGLSGVIPPGEDITLILYNNSTSNKTISLTNFPTRNVDTITVPAKEKAEINILGSRNDANTENYYYARGILYKD